DRGAADAALHRAPAPGQLADRGAGARTDVAFDDRRRRCRLRRAVAAIRRRPDLRVPADDEVDEAGGGHDRDVHGAAVGLEADVLLVEIPHDARTAVEAERAAAGQTERVDLL